MQDKNDKKIINAYIRSYNYKNQINLQLELLDSIVNQIEQIGTHSRALREMRKILLEKEAENNE